MKKLTILLAVLLLASNNLFSQKKTKPSAKPKPVSAPVQSDFNSRFYVELGLSQIGDEYLGNTVNYLVGLEKQVSRYITVGGGLNYSSYPALTEKMTAEVFRLLEAEGFNTTRLIVDIGDFDVSCFELEGQMKVKFTKTRDGFYGRAGITAMSLKKSKYSVLIQPYPWTIKPTTTVMNAESELLLAWSFGVGYDYDLSNRTGLWAELKFTPSLGKSKISDVTLFQTNFGIGFYYRY